MRLQVRLFSDGLKFGLVIETTTYLCAMLLKQLVSTLGNSVIHQLMLIALQAVIGAFFIALTVNKIVESQLDSKQIFIFLLGFILAAVLLSCIAVLCIFIFQFTSIDVFDVLNIIASIFIICFCFKVHKRS